MTEHAASGLFATDMDGTLLRSGGDFHQADLTAMERLGRMGYLRVIATGRSPFSFQRLLGGRTLPVDFLVLSSGAGIVDAATGQLLRKTSMSPEETRFALGVLREMELDLCLQAEVPENHVFSYSYVSGRNSDLEARISLYEGHCAPLDPRRKVGPSAQLLVITPEKEGERVLLRIREKLDRNYSILRTTSPLDGRSMWIEIFPRGVSKSRGVEWLASRHGIDSVDVAAVGNDYNDHDLLEWAGCAYVVDGSPRGLRDSFHRLPFSVGGAVAEAARRWLTGRKCLSDEDPWP